MRELFAEIRGSQARDGFGEVGGRDGEVCSVESVSVSGLGKEETKKLTKSLLRHQLDGLDENLELRFQRIKDEFLLVEPLRER